MRTSIYERLSEIDLLLLTLQSQLEQAEAVIPQINERVKRIAEAAGIDDAVILGEIIVDQNYLSPTGPEDSGVLLIATLIVPSGIGASLWDSEEFWHYRNGGAASDRDVQVRFLDFGLCSPMVRAMLLAHAGPLLEKLSELTIQEYEQSLRDS